MTPATLTYRVHGCTVHEHTLHLPLDRSDAASQLIPVFAREIIADGSEDRPYFVFLQGGPGSPSPRQGDPTSGWIGRALKDYRVLLLDQRGTGRSHRLDELTLSGLAGDAERADYLTHFRADAIVADAEDFRAALGSGPWYALGQSYGGFCLTTYLSRAPEGLAGVYITGGLPGVGVSVDEIYRRTYAQTIRRNRVYLERFPDAELIREIARHLEDTDERLPTGERLSARRFRTLGMNLGTTTGFDALHFLLEDPFVTVRGRRRLSIPFLVRVADQLSFADRPLYALMHETIYAGATPALAGIPTAWAADRIRTEFDGMAEDASPDGEQFYLTGEHIYPWQFDEDPALIALKGTAHILAAKTDWSPLYDEATLAANDVPVAAAVYAEDMFVPTEYSLALADMLGARVWLTNEYQHDGLRASSGEVLGRLIDLAKQ